jgi:hypothetical protein
MSSIEVIAILIGLALAWGPLWKGLMTLFASLYLLVRGVKKVKIKYKDINGISHVKVVYAENYDKFIASLRAEGGQLTNKVTKSDGKS